MVLPFNNRVDSFDLLGRYIWEALEYSSIEINNPSTHLKQFLQISGKPLKFLMKSMYQSKNLCLIDKQIISRFEICGECYSTKIPSSRGGRGSVSRMHTG